MRTLLPVMALIAALVLVSCAPGAAPTQNVGSTPLATATSTPTIAPTSTPTQTVSPSPTPTPTATIEMPVLTVESLVCERFFPGVPNPDGPSEWLNVTGSLLNAGEQKVDLTDMQRLINVEVLDSTGTVILTLVPVVNVATIGPGQSAMFATPPHNAHHPTAVSCNVRSSALSSGRDIALTGDLTAEIEIFAAP